MSVLLPTNASKDPQNRMNHREIMGQLLWVLEPISVY